MYLRFFNTPIILFTYAALMPNFSLISSIFAYGFLLMYSFTLVWASFKGEFLSIYNSLKVLCEKGIVTIIKLGSISKALSPYLFTIIGIP